MNYSLLQFIIGNSSDLDNTVTALQYQEQLNNTNQSACFSEVQRFCLTGCR